MKKLSMDELNRLSREEFKQAKKAPIVVVLDNVRSMHNVGSIFRTSDAFAIEKLYLCGITARPPHRDIEKAALGATESVDWEYAEDTLVLINKLKSEGYTILSIEQAENSISLENYSVNKSEKYAIIFGNEVEGVQQEVINASNACIEIPQFGTKHSFNVSVTAAIVLWQLRTN
jgi:23S rRNA (guanosine2251-2'-O)-methyltransferase